jgi:hypothetical protein
MDVQLRDEPVSDDVRSAALLTLRRRKREPSDARSCALGGSARCGVSPCPWCLAAR